MVELAICSFGKNKIGDEGSEDDAESGRADAAVPGADDEGGEEGGEAGVADGLKQAD